MPQTMIDKAISRFHDQRWGQMAGLFRIKFRAEVSTRYDLMIGSGGGYITERTDRKPLTTEQRAWIEAYCEGLGAFEGALLLAQDEMRAKKPRTKN